MNDATPRLVVGIGGASGAILGLRVLELLRRHVGVEIHLVVSDAAQRTLTLEIGNNALEEAQALASVTHNIRDLAAPIASGSFRTAGMIVAPCSMRSLAAIAHALSDNLLTRAADVTLKERRRLVLLARSPASRRASRGDVENGGPWCHHTAAGPGLLRPSPNPRRGRHADCGAGH